MTLEALWEEFLKIICAEVGSRVVETWFKAVTFVQWDPHLKIVYLKAPNEFVREWVSTHYRDLIAHHVGRLLNEQELKIIFIEGSTLPEKKIEEVPLAYVASRTSESLPSLQGAYQFDTFVVGPHNSLAYAAAHAVSENPGNLYNPLLICGGSGVGKTHLLQAIGNQLRRIHKQVKILYQSADRFVHDFVLAVRMDKVRQFESKYKELDVLLMDDIQLMANKEGTQEFFFHIFTTLQHAHKQVVCTSDLMPQRLLGLGDRMRTRLEGGLVADIQTATLDARVAIIKKKSAYHEITLSDDIAYFIAARVDSNIRDLEGSLMRLMAFASLTQQPITLDLAHSVLAQSHEAKKKTTEMSHILQQVSHFFDYSVKELRSTKRSKDLALARHISIYFMKRFTDKSLREIASFLDRKDHSSVLHAIEKIERQRTCNASLSLLLEKLEQKIIH